jgi:predicted transcriptional regulator
MKTKTTTNVVPLHGAKDKKESEKKWGKSVMDHGYCVLPSLLLQAQSRLAVNAQEMIVLLQLVEHWWTADGEVFPSKKVIAERVGLSTKQVQRHIARLEEAKLVLRVKRYKTSGGRTSNLYDLSGLVAKLKSIEADVAKAKKFTAAAKKPGGLVGNKDD